MNKEGNGERGNDGLFRRILHMLGGQTARIVVQAAYFVVLARALGATDFGGFSAVVALAAIVTPFSSLGSNILMIRSVSRQPDTRATEWYRAGGLTTLGGVILALVVSTIGVVWLAAAGVSFIALVFILLADLVGQKLVETAAGMWQSAGNSRPLLVWPTVLNSLRLGAALALLLLPSPSLDLWALLYLIATLPFAIGVTIYTSIRVGRARVSLRMTRAELGTGLSFSVGLASQTVYNDIDKVMLAGLNSALSAGLYSAAYRLVDMAYVPVRAIAATTYPLFFRGGSAGIRGSLVLARRVAPIALGYAAVAAVGLALLAPLVPIILGSDFSGTETVLPWLAVVLVTRTSTFLAADSLTGADRVGSRTLVQLIVAALNVLLNFWLIPSYGIAGAIASTLLCEVVLTLALWVLVIREWKKGPDID